MQLVIKTFKAYYTRRSFAHLHEAMGQNNERSVKDFWKQFNVLDAVRIIGQSWNEKLLVCYEEILQEKKKNLTRQARLLEYIVPVTSK